MTELSRKAMMLIIRNYAKKNDIPIAVAEAHFAPPGKWSLVGGKKAHREWVAKTMERMDEE